jgi:hypothetical protein
MSRQKKSKTKSSKLAKLSAQVKYLSEAAEGFQGASNNIEDLYDDGTLLLMNALTIGDAVSNRDGSRIVTKEIGFRAKFLNTSTTARPLVRMVVVQVKAPNGVAPSTDEILADAGSNVSALSPHNYYEKDRFIFLKDETIVLNYAGQVDSAKMMEFKSNKPIKVTYNSTNGGTIADIETNAVYVLLLTDLPSPIDSVDYNYYRWIRFLK